MTRDSGGVGLVAEPFQLGEDDAGRSVRVEHAQRPPNVRYHYHPECELLLVRGGAGRRIIGDRIADYSGRELVLVGPKLPHAWIAEPPVFQRQDADFTVVLFTRESIGIEFLQKPELRPIDALLEAAARGLAFDPAAAGSVEQAILDLPGLQGCARLLAFLGMLHCLAAEGHPSAIVSEHYEASDVELEHAVLARALQYVHENSERRIPLAEISAQVGMSIPTFTRFFKRMTGMTFVSYLNQWRIRRACILLRETRASVLEISLAVGYGNLSHFNRQFLKYRSLTPLRYRHAGS